MKFRWIHVLLALKLRWSGAERSRNGENEKEKVPFRTVLELFESMPKEENEEENGVNTLFNESSYGSRIFFPTTSLRAFRKEIGVGIVSFSWAKSPLRGLLGPSGMTWRVEISLKSRWSPVEVPLKYRWSSVEIPLNFRRKAGPMNSRQSPAPLPSFIEHYIAFLPKPFLL